MKQIQEYKQNLSCKLNTVIFPPNESYDYILTYIGEEFDILVYQRRIGNVIVDAIRPIDIQGVRIIPL